LHFTKDKVYEVKQSEQYENYYEVLQNDLGVKQPYKKERFERVEDKIKLKYIGYSAHGCTEGEIYEGHIDKARRCFIFYDDDIIEHTVTNFETLFEKVEPQKEAKINYEEECKKLKEENEHLKERINKYQNKLLEKLNKIEELKATNATNYDEYKEHLKMLQEENEEIKAEINQLRDEVRQTNFKLKDYETKLPQIKLLVVKLVDINKILASNIYVEELEE
jgi:regulator of replication initiation timing